jgi:hypothetical protein
MADRTSDMWLLRHVRFERTIHCTGAKWFEACRMVCYLSCLFMDICYVTSPLSRPMLNEWALFIFKLCKWAVSLILSFVTFRKERVITERWNILGKIWFFQNYCRTIYPTFLTFFSEKRRFCKRNKNCAVRKRYSKSERSSEESNNTSNTGQPHG